MSPSIFIQFDREVADLQALLADLRLAGYDVLAAHSSRWVGRDPLTGAELDAGPRLDIEISYRASSAARPLIDAIDDFLIPYAT